MLTLEPHNPLVLAKKQEFEANMRHKLFSDAIHIPPILLDLAYIAKLGTSLYYVIYSIIFSC